MIRAHDGGFHRASAYLLEGALVDSPIFWEELVPRPKSTGPTQREEEVLALLLEGQDRGEIAAKLWIVRKTVDAHCRSLQRKFGVFSDVALVKEAVRRDPKNGAVGPRPGRAWQAMSRAEKLSDVIGYRPEVGWQADAEGLPAAGHLMAKSCFELASSHEGWADVLLKKQARVYALPARIRAIVDASPGREPYTGRFNKYCLVHASPTFSDEPDYGRLVGEVVEIAPEHAVAPQDFFAEIRAAITRAPAGEGLKVFTLHESMIPNMIVCHLALVTTGDRDKYVVVGQRGPARTVPPERGPRYYQKHWSVTAEEQMNAREDEKADGTPDVFRTFRRGLKEELVGEGLSESDIQVTIHSCFREFDLAANHRLHRQAYVLNTGIAAVVEVPLTLKEVARNWRDARDLKDRAEFKNLVGIELTFDNLWHLLNSPQFPHAWDKWEVIGQPLAYCGLDPQEREWHPSSFLRSAMLLNKYFPDKLDKALESPPGG